MRFLVVVFWWCGGWWGGSQCSLVFSPIAGAKLDQRSGSGSGSMDADLALSHIGYKSSFANLRFSKLETGAGRVRGAVSDWWWAGSDAGGTPH